MLAYSFFRSISFPKFSKNCFYSFLKFLKIFQFNQIFFKLGFKLCRNLYKVSSELCLKCLNTKLLWFINCIQNIHTVLPQNFNIFAVCKIFLQFPPSFSKISLKLFKTIRQKFLELPLNFTLLGTDSAFISVPTWTIIKESCKWCFAFIDAVVATQFTYHSSNINTP